jgi:predicted glycosyltransferase involved in capsule biosynthesis
MLLSILIPGKNDNYRNNGTKTLELNLKQTIDNLNKLNKNDVEIVLCDWGSKIKITDQIIQETCSNFRCVYVNPEITQKYNKLANYSIVHPINTAFRNSKGKYVIFWDSDCLVTYENFVNLYNFVENMEKNNDRKFYWGSRFHIPYEVYTPMKEISELHTYLETNPNLLHDKIDVLNFAGCSISILMNRDLWQESTGWYEELIYWGWQDIEFHNRLLSRYQFGGDLEDFNIKFYHLNQPIDIGEHKNKVVFNSQINSNKFTANNSDWGLANENLEIY